MQLPAIEVDGLYFAYDKEYVLENINLTIYDKEYIAIIGPNGGGKTTFLKLLLGLLQPQKGKISIYGKEPSQAKNLIGYLPQQTNFNLDMPLQAKEIILQGRLSAKKFRFDKDDLTLLDEIAQKLNIAHLLHKKIGTLSGGQRQRVLLARALITKPKILILDEPTAAVDIEAQKEIYEILRNLSITRLVVSHDVNILLEGVDRVLYINRTLYIHDNLKLNIQKRDGHFCEMELFEELKKACIHD
ncbi:metal ABC transporter ATP-binding protein [Nitratiruptor tergarcus]|uniref:Zinc transport system ATP-binding protein n=1 Tax=Nitratiruptor tergarcus DSM 16512 TaxID=1069081 RepID=A0A1W1WS28_9BACT|nr:metal ABC transporter ATP-binding protein [Nitratiruptor tergarcus]SMC09012.1 zinc transport system ATP-binding protein [Nitratiruptor tergarcus DSM 16512]